MKIGINGVSLESCFFLSYDDAYLTDLKAKLDEKGNRDSAERRHHRPAVNA